MRRSGAQGLGRRDRSEANKGRESREEGEGGCMVGD